MEVSRHWRLRGVRLRLEGVKYTGCGHVALQDRPVCPICAEEANPRFQDLELGQAVTIQVPQDLEIADQVG